MIGSRVRLLAFGCFATVAAPAIDPSSALAFTWGNLVLTTGAEVREYRTDGAFIAAIPVPYPAGPRGGQDPLVGVTFDAEARLAVYNGAAFPYLSVYDAGLGSWTHSTLAGWSMHALGGYSGIVAFGNDIVAADVNTATGSANGLVSFDGGAGYAARRDNPGIDYSDLAAGPDGQLHALVAQTSIVFLFDPVTMANTGSVQLEGSVQSIAVAPDGTYLGASGDGYIRRFTAQGASYDTLDTAIPGLIDVAVAATGEIVMSTALGEVVLCDADLSFSKTFLVGGGPAYVAWVPPHATTPAARRSWGRIKDFYRR